MPQGPAVGGLVDVAYKAETTLGTSPTGDYQKLRTIRTSLTFGKNTYTSEQRSSARMRKDVRHGYHDVAGDIMGELSNASWDDFLEAALGGTWASSMASTVYASAQITASRISATSATFITSGLKVGDIFSLSTDVQALARHQIASISETGIDVKASTLTASAAAASATVAGVGKKLGLGSTYRSFTIEKYFSDIGLYQAFQGCRVNSASLQVPPTGMLGVTFGLMGVTASAIVSTTVASTYVAETTTSPYAAVDGAVYEADGVAELAVVTGFTINMSQNMQRTQVLGRNTSPHILFGRFVDVTGTLTLLFNGVGEYNKFVNETESAVDLVVYDGSNVTTSKFLRLRMPRIKYTGGDVDDGADVAIPITMPFVALEPITESGEETKSIVLQRSNTS